MNEKINSTVYVVQGSHNIDLTSASHYGELVRVTKDNFPINFGDDVRHVLAFKTALKNFNPATDYLLVVGDPVNIGLAFAVLLQMGIRVFRVLKFQRQAGQYITVTVEI